MLLSFQAAYKSKHWQPTPIGPVSVYRVSNGQHKEGSEQDTWWHTSISSLNSIKHSLSYRNHFISIRLLGPEPFRETVGMRYFLEIRPVQKTAWFLVKIRHFSQNTISLNIGPNIHFNRLGNGDEVHHQVGQFCLGKRGPCAFNFLRGRWTVVLRIDWPHFSLSRTAGCALGIKENTTGSSCWSID